jgi:hypothetical protein
MPFAPDLAVKVVGHGPGSVGPAGFNGRTLVA